MIEQDANSSVGSDTLIWTTSKNVFNRSQGDAMASPSPSVPPSVPPSTEPSPDNTASTKDSSRPNDLDITRDSDYMDVMIVDFDGDLEDELDMHGDLESGPPDPPPRRVTFAERLITSLSPKKRN